MAASHPLERSSFYRLQSPAKLAELLGTSLAALEALANGGVENYSIFDRETKPGKTRHIEWPKAKLRGVQRRIVALLRRIECPSYLHSAFRGRSYITNAGCHQFDKPSAKIDIRNFFPSADSKRVSRVFREIFECAPDVAALIGKLTTLHGHIPTGGNSSTMISFWAYKPMFDEIHQLCGSAGVTMSCCVDDMTLTGDAVSEGFLNQVRVVIRRYKLRTHKVRYFPASKPKIVTGVVVTGNGLRLPNARRKRVHESFVAVENELDAAQKLQAAQKLLGRVTEAAQIEPSFVGQVYAATVLLRDAKKAAKN